VAENGNRQDGKKVIEKKTVANILVYQPFFGFNILDITTFEEPKRFNNYYLIFLILQHHNKKIELIS
jgi:hypothetical protein